MYARLLLYMGIKRIFAGEWEFYVCRGAVIRLASRVCSET